MLGRVRPRAALLHVWRHRERRARVRRPPPAPCSCLRRLPRLLACQWPAVVDSYAAPVEGDTPEMALLRPLLRQTQARGCALCIRFVGDARRGADARVLC